MVPYLRTALLSVFAAVVCVAHAVPATVEYQFEATSDFAGFPAPVAFSGVAVFDTDAPEIPPLGGLTGTFYELLSHTIAVNGTTISPSTSPSGSFFSVVTLEDNFPISGGTAFSDRFRVVSTVNHDLGDGVTLATVGFQLAGDENVFTGGSLFVPELSDFTSMIGGIGYDVVGVGLFGNSFPLTAIQIRVMAVPEPGTLVLTGLALLVVGLVRCRYRTRAMERRLRIPRMPVHRS
jgi:hypothetical protein